MRRAILLSLLALIGLGGCYPNPSSTGTPSGWTPSSTRSTDLSVTTPGATVQDVRLTNSADIIVRAPNVTIRRVELQGGVIDNDPGTCGNGMLVENSTILPPAGGASNDGEAVISYGGYTARGVEIENRNEGFRVSSKGDCGPVTIENSFAKIVAPPGCGDWHGDGIQSWQGDAVTVRNTTIDMRTSGCYGTAPFFRPYGQGNVGCATIDGLLVMGQGFPFRLGTCGTVRGLQIVNNSWVFGPIDVKCSVISSWDAQIVTIDSNYGVTGLVREQPCNTEGGG